MKLFSSRRRRWTAGAAILLLLFLLRPGASRLKSRIIASISSAVGRSVDIGSVSIRLLPRPGFDLENLVVYDDPAFGAEPMLRASEVTASLRLTSLLRGRIEIARLDLSDPSLNLVHADDGRWNLEALVERTAHAPTAPTAKAKLERRPGFPYIEATAARINFKNGAEKKPFALTNADFSLWQDSENAWGIRLKAQPVRTDLNLNDTGILQIAGTWQRAATLRETPLQMSLEWRRAQLGQLTKLFTRSDQGWRGGVDLEATLTGTPSKLQLSTGATIQDFRRYDITSGEPLRLAAHCDGEYSSLDHSFHQMLCTAPVGPGLITLKGNAGLPGSHQYELVLMATEVPANALIAVVERAKKNLPEDLTSAGVLRGSIAIHETTDSPLRLQGEGEIADFQLASAVNKIEIGAVTIPFALDHKNAGDSRRSRRENPARATEQAHLELGPFPIATEHGSNASVRGWISRSGYDFSLTGESSVARALRVIRLAGLPVLNTTADGSAQLDLEIAGQWGWSANTQADFRGAQITGLAKLHEIRVPVRGAAAPVEIVSADLQLSPAEAKIEKLNARAAGALWSGSLAMPRGCGTPGACEVHFDLKADQISMNELSGWTDPPLRKQPWYRVLDSAAQPRSSVLGNVIASGRVSVSHLQAGGLTASHASATVNLDRGKLQISDLQADVLGGSYQGSWQSDFGASPATCKASGSLSGLHLDGLADAGKEPVISGMADATYQVSGACGAGSATPFSTAFLASAEGSVDFELHDGALPRLFLEEDAPLKSVNLSGQARLHGGTLEVEKAKLDSSSGKFLLSGTASLQRDLKFHLLRSVNPASGGYSITGTLAAPQVDPLPGAEQARLKTDTNKP